MEDLWILYGSLMTPTGVLNNGAIHLYDGVIQWLGPVDEAPTHDILHYIDARDKFVGPGLIDTQINGGFGHDFTLSPETIWEVAARLPQYGITSFLPTIITSPLETVDRAIQTLQEKPTGFQGSEPIGLHLEGPFISPHKKGAHPKQHLRAPNPAAVEDWSPESGVRLVTLAPELDAATELVEILDKNGVIVSAGHSMATYAESQRGFLAGIRAATHIFNAMGPLHHRLPGLAGAVMDTPHISFGLIADGIHLHPSLIRQLWKLAKDRMILVSDGMAALGMLPGEYRLGDQTVIVNTRSARLKNNTLAGSIAPLNRCLANLIQWTECAIEDGIRTATSHPAKLLNLTHKGELAPGKDGDLVIFNREMEISHTIVDGELVYSSSQLLA